MTFAVRVYDPKRRKAIAQAAHDYVAVALARMYGGVCWVSQISSPRLFDAMRESLPEIMAAVGATVIEGPMSEPMYRALREKLSGIAEVDIARWVKYEGHGRLPWVQVRLLDNLTEGELT